MPIKMSTVVAYAVTSSDWQLNKTSLSNFSKLAKFKKLVDLSKI